MASPIVAKMSTWSVGTLCKEIQDLNALLVQRASSGTDCAVLATIASKALAAKLSKMTLSSADVLALGTALGACSQVLKTGVIETAIDEALSKNMLG